MLSLVVFSQQTINGVITDQAGEGLIGATILVEGTSTGTVTDVEGRFSLNIPDGSSGNLLISYTGYTNQVVLIPTDGSDLNIQLETDALQLQDVVVTANKRSQSAQDVPISISVLGARELTRIGAAQFQDYAISIPNLSFGTQGGGSGVTLGRNTNQVALRGISGTNTTTFYLDNTPLPENIDPRILDLSRVEVLRGPQGTLYGSNTLGGAIKLVTNAPDAGSLAGNFSVTAGAVQEGDLDYGINGVLNIPIAKDKLALRVSGFYDFTTGVLDRETIAGVNVLNNSRTLDAAITGDPAAITTDECVGCNLPDEKNIDDDQKYGFMANLGFTPTKNISISAKVINQSTRAEGSNMRDLRADNFTQLRGNHSEEYFDEDWTHYSLSASFKFNSGEIVTSTSYFDQFYEEQEEEGSFLSTAILGFDGVDNLDYWGGFIRANVDYARLTHETRYLSKFDGPFNFVAGVFYSDEDIDHNSFSLKPGLITFLGAPAFLDEIQWWNFDRVNKQTEWSLFGEAYYSFNDKFKATLGLRYFDARKEVDGLQVGGPVDYVDTPVSGIFEESGVSPKFGLEYRIDENNLIFTNVSRGFRLGDVNSPVPEQFCGDELAALGTEVPATFESDFIWNYELGYKGTLADGRLILNGTIFLNNWTNFRQQRFFESCGFGFDANVGSARTIGFELEGKAKLTKNFKLGYGLGLNNAEVTEGGEGLLAEEGDNILFVAPVTANFNLEYTKTINDNFVLFARYDLQHVGERTSVFNPEERTDRVFDPFTTMNFRVGTTFNKFEVSLFARNLTNESANFGDLLSIAAETPGRPRYRTNRPRTIGIQARVFF